MIYYYYYDSPIGILTIIADSHNLLYIFLEKVEYSGHYLCNEVISSTIEQLDEYFLGTRITFEIPYTLNGTAFQNRVWQQLCQIEYGTVCSYSDIANDINHPKACRAIGNANNRNPIPIIIPCHRVIGKNKQMVGYAGGVEIKMFLLALEGYCI